MNAWCKAGLYGLAVSEPRDCWNLVTSPSPVTLSKEVELPIIRGEPAVVGPCGAADWLESADRPARWLTPEVVSAKHPERLVLVVVKWPQPSDRLSSVPLPGDPSPSRPYALTYDTPVEEETPESPCEETFQRLAIEDPQGLIRLIGEGTLEVTDLTFAAEIAGDIPDSNLVRPILLRLLGHSSPLVREGAVYGLRHHLNQETYDRLTQLMKSDPSPGVREAAAEAIENAA